MLSPRPGSRSHRVSVSTGTPGRAALRGLMVGCAWNSGTASAASAGWFPRVSHHAWLKMVDQDASTGQVYTERFPEWSQVPPPWPLCVPRAQPQRGHPSAALGLWGAPVLPLHPPSVMLEGRVRLSPWLTRDQSPVPRELLLPMGPLDPPVLLPSGV